MFHDDPRRAGLEVEDVRQVGDGRRRAAVAALSTRDDREGELQTVVSHVEFAVDVVAPQLTHDLAADAHRSRPSGGARELRERFPFADHGLEQASDGRRQPQAQVEAAVRAHEQGQSEGRKEDPSAVEDVTQDVLHDA